MKVLNLQHRGNKSKIFDKIMNTKSIQLEVDLYLKDKFKSARQAGHRPMTTLAECEDLSSKIYQVTAYNELRKIHLKSNLIIKHQLKKAKVDSRIINRIQVDHFALPKELEGLDEYSSILNPAFINHPQ